MTGLLYRIEYSGFGKSKMVQIVDYLLEARKELPTLTVDIEEWNYISDDLQNGMIRNESEVKAFFDKKMRQLVVDLKAGLVLEGI